MNAFHLFDVAGVELEYMVVDVGTLDVRPVADEFLRALAGTEQYVSDAELGPIAWSNELVAHLVELKTNGPVASLETLPALFGEHVRKANAVLATLGARLMPTAMHPWMDPARETRLWPHEYADVYRTFDSIFNCRAHGWANVQSVHLNLPFSGDEEFARLHAAVRLVLPILPALAASSPFLEGRFEAGARDNRLFAYEAHTRMLPAVAGCVIPEPVFTEEEYRRAILEPMYAEIAPHDPDALLRHEWLNARGAIARFERGSIEIRLLDMQECPAADVAICAAVIGVLKALVAERWSGLAEQRRWDAGRLQRIMRLSARDGEQAELADAEYLAQFGWSCAGRCTAGDLWRHLVQAAMPESGIAEAVWRKPLGVILEHGPLAKRIVKATSTVPPPGRLRAVYHALCDALERGVMFQPHAPGE